MVAGEDFHPTPSRSRWLTARGSGEREVGRAAVLGAHRPASTLIIGGLSNPAWKVEVEGIAVA